MSDAIASPEDSRIQIVKLHPHLLAVTCAQVVHLP